MTPWTTVCLTGVQSTHTSLRTLRLPTEISSKPSSEPSSSRNLPLCFSRSLTLDIFWWNVCICQIMTSYIDCWCIQIFLSGLGERVLGLLPGCSVFQRPERIWKEEERSQRGCRSKQGCLLFFIWSVVAHCIIWSYDDHHHVWSYATKDHVEILVVSSQVYEISMSTVIISTSSSFFSSSYWTYFL